jgi:hypothetical protein
MTPEEERRIVLIAWFNFSKSDHGKIILDDLEKTYKLEVAHVAGDPYSTAFHEGERAGAYVYPLRMIEEALEMLKMEGE